MRQGGVSQANYASLNINPYCGDHPSDVEQNRKMLCEHLNISDANLIIPHQVHETTVRQIGKELCLMSPSAREMILNGVDALITDVPHVCIGVSTADCIPLLLYDPEHQATAAIHAGWRGTVARIAQKAVKSMQIAYQTNPSKLLAAIGPGISLEHFEVGDEVYQTFVEAGFNMEKIARHKTKWHIDLPFCNQLQLQEAGVQPANIQSTGICTYAQNNDYFSARKQGINSGRIFTGILIKN